MPKADRLFVPLAEQPYRWFASGHKTWELRAKRGQFTEQHIDLGRRVELRRGYSTPDSLWGVIEDAIVAPTVEAFFDQVSWQQVICDPAIKTREQAEAMARTMIKSVPVIGFKIKIDSARVAA
jgi:hypothetical protein